MSSAANRSPSPSLDRAADFMWRNARLLERAIFAHVFLGGPAESVTAALRAYRNPDGGLGNALEADIRAPMSLPLHCESGLRALHAAGVRDQPLASGICEFLASVAEPDGRVEIATTDIRGYPRAAHWENPSFGGDSLNPTAGLVGLLWYQGAGHPWLARAAEWCWRRVERPLDDAHEIATALRFLEHAPDRSRAQKVAIRIAGNCDRAKWYLKDAAFPDYGVTPIQLCPRPDSIVRAAFADGLIQAHLDRLASLQQSDGGWPITWQAPGPGAALEWRGTVTLEALISLRAYGRI